MKRLFSLCILLLPLFSEAQYIKTGIIVGMNAAQVDGDDLAGYKRVGLNTGAYARIPVGKHFSSTIELLYSQKGSREFPDTKIPNKKTYKLVLDYAEVPVLFQYHDRDRIMAGLGFSLGQLVRFLETRDEDKVIWDPQHPVKRQDYNMLFTASYLLARHWDINIRFSFSMANISKGSTSFNWNQKHINRYISFRLVYNINPDEKGAP